MYAKQKTCSSTKQEDEESKGEDKSVDKSDFPIKEEKSPPSRMGASDVDSNVIAHDGTECRFNLNSYKILFVINKENLLYKKNAFTKAKKVTKQQLP